jgi:hypothetical protein
VETTLARHLLNEHITRQIVAHTLPLIGQRPTLVFASSVSHAKQLAAQFCAQGAKAVAISGQTGRKQRDELFAKWRSGAIQIVCNCSLFTEGMDFPPISALVIARPTLSPALYMQMLGRGMRLADGKIDCLVIDLIGNQPDPRRQVILPHVVGIEEELEERSTKEPTDTKKIDPILQRILGGQGETGLALLDPLGRSHYRWASYSKGYFARINASTTAFLYRDPHGSGLYRYYLCAHLPSDKQLKCQCIGPQYLPLRQQVSLVHENTKNNFRESFAGKEAHWLKEPATEKQLSMLGRYHKRLPEYARQKGWTKLQASDAITYYQLREILLNPPEPEIE